MNHIHHNHDKNHIILRRVQSDFDDFSFVDVQQQFIDFGVLTIDECEEILAEVDENVQNDRLFFILIYKKKDVKRFVDALQTDYQWLCEKLTNCNERNDQLILKYESAIKHSDIPKNRDLNIHRCKYLWQIQQYLKHLRRGQFLCLHSKIGCGKSWLASDACIDFNIVKHMDYKIFWVNLSKCTTPDAILEKLYCLKIILHAADDVDEKFYNCGNANTQNEIVNMKRHLRNVLESDNYKNCLLILSDVQTRDTYKAFDLHCKILMTTKYVHIIDEISKESKYIVNVSEGFSEDESFSLLSRALKTTVRDLPLQANEIHEKCQGYPFIISLIAKNFAEFSLESNDRRKRRWQTWVSKLNDYNVPSLIDQTLNQLSNKLQNYYKSLVIFTDNVNIPIKVLERYWEKNESECEEIVKRFEKNSLLEINYIDTDVVVCSLHYLYYAYLLKEVNPKDKREMHETLVKKYDINNVMKFRKEYELFDFPNDNYFYYNIGYHLKEAETVDLFPLLYLDIGFLEKKLRITGLPNTIGDLKTYKAEILGPQKDRHREELIDNILEFLPSVEEFLYKSSDTVLLQYALTSTGVLREEALKQAAVYPNRLWMEDIDHTQRQRQIVKIPQKPTVVKFRNLNASLIALEDSKILLKDLSQEYTVGQTYYCGHTGGIKYIELFQHEYFLSLDGDGSMKIWSLKHTPVDRRLSGNYDNENGVSTARKPYLDVPNMSHGKCVQTLPETGNGKNGKNNKYVSFCINERTTSVDGIATVICATRSGWIYLYKWYSNVFVLQKEFTFYTNFFSIYSILFIPSHFLLVLGENGTISFFNLRSQAKIAYTKQWSPEADPIRMYLIERSSSHNIDEEDDKIPLIVICVFKHKLIEISISKMMDGLIFTEFTDIYQVTENNKITSSAMSDDVGYIILGTEQGIVVVDRMKKCEVLRSSVSDHILSVDICDQYSEIYKYVLISSALRGGESVNLHGLMISNQKSRTMSWRRGSPTSFDSYTSEEDLNTWLKGGKLFTVKENNGEEMSIFAVDSERRIHYRSSQTHFNKDKTYKRLKNPPSAICSSNSACYVGCTDGIVLKLGNTSPVLHMNQAIEYMKLLKPNVLVVGTDINYRLFCFGDEEDFSGVAQPDYAGKVANAYNICNNYICIIKLDCSFEIFDDATRICYSHQPNLLYGCVCTTYFDNLLMIGTRRSGLFIYRIEMIEDDLKILSENVMLTSENPQFLPGNDLMTSICISADKAILAVGYVNGSINLYNLTKLKLLQMDLSQLNATPANPTQKINKLHIQQQLLSHESPVNDLIFSPWHDPNAPIILVSIAAELIFWNVRSALNNPWDRQSPSRPQQRSHRFSKGNLTYQRTKSNEKDNRKSSQLYTNHSLWQHKEGPSEKPELLSCLKFVGNAAERLFTNTDFSKFVTIDNEGNIYFLRLIDFANYSNIPSIQLPANT